MRVSANSRENAGTGLRAISLACLLGLLLPTGSLLAEPPAETQFTAPEKPLPAIEEDPFSPDSLPALTPTEPGNSLRDNSSVPLPPQMPPENVLAPPANPPRSPEQKLIPITKPGGDNNLVVEDYHGQISLMVRDAPLRQVVALVAETQKLNLVFATPAETRITASFDRVPWEQVLDSLLSASGHTWTTSNGVITVSSLTQAESLSPSTGGRRVEVFDLDFASAVDIDQTVKGLLSSAGKSWIMETNSADNRRTREAVAVIDYPQNLQQIADYIALTDQPPRQVLIEANILQIDLSSDCRSGIDLGALSTSASGNTIEFDPVGLANASASPAFFLDAPGGSITALVELLQTTTDAKTLASPKILAVSGQQSKLQVGERLGFRVTTTTQTSTLEEVQFLDVGVVLTVTPRISRDGRVLMRIKPEVSTGQVDPDTGLPSSDTTEVETDILLCDGQGMVIGGLIQEQDSNIQSKLPWIADLPYVGILFQRRQVTKSRSEIVVTLVPHIQPYTPVVEARENFDVARSFDRLTTGPLNRYPRPYEARLPDTFLNPRRPLMTLLQPLPPVEQAAYCPPANEVMLEYPPQEAERPSPDFHK